MRLHYPLNPTTGVEDSTFLPWTDGIPQTGQEGSFPPSAMCVEPMTEIVNLLLEVGLTPTSADLFQLLRSIRGGQLTTFWDVGAVNAMAINPKTAHTSLLKGLPLRIFPANTNTSQTVTLKVGLLSANVFLLNGSPPGVGDIVAGQPVDVVYDTTIPGWRLMSGAQASSIAAGAISALTIAGIVPTHIDFFLSDGVWMPRTGIVNAWGEINGGGGGGGGGSTHGGGGGGGGGGYANGPFKPPPGVPVPIKIGLPGLGGAGNTNNQAYNGTTGGTTSIGSYMSATGGNPGGGGPDGVAGTAAYGGMGYGPGLCLPGDSSQAGGSTGPAGNGTGGGGGGSYRGAAGTSNTGGSPNGGNGRGGGGGGGAGGNNGANGSPGIGYVLS